ncbi:hypothetical protein QYF36_000341 [Acer negundo]|nr:hypothetical protein QYF36_000341 [Acer negundo]
MMASGHCHRHRMKPVSSSSGGMRSGPGGRFCSTYGACSSNPRVLVGGEPMSKVAEMSNKDTGVASLESSMSESSDTMPKIERQCLSRWRNCVGNNNEPNDVGDSWVLVTGVF